MENPLTKHIHDTLAFGTYRLSGPTASARVRAALELGFRRIDTAQLYGNETAVYAAIRDFEATHRTERVVVTSKIYENLRFEPTVEKVAASARLLGRPIDVMLLHRPLPPIMWRALNACVDAGHVTRIGVSNHGVEQLEALRQACGTELRPPSVDQVELHPFVGPIHPLLSYCQAHGIRVQGHTALARGELLDFPPLVRLAEARRCSAAVLLLRWAHQLGAALVVQSSRDDHLREIWEDLPTLEPIDARDMATISGFYARLTRRFFAQRVTPASIPELDATTDTHAYVDAVAALLRADQAAEREGLPVSDAALGLTTQTRQQLLRDPVANQIAERLFPEDAPTASHSRYRELVRRLRNSALARRAGLPKPKRTSCSVPHDHPALAPRVVDGTPVSASVAAPSPMPVEVSPAGELAPFFDFLASAQEVRAPATFVRGTYFPDHRMDLCKQVVGPDHVEALCAAVSARAERDGAHQVRHFLLGNNIACAGDSIAGAEAFARLMADPSVAIETWYLAGNAIGPDVAQIAPRARQRSLHPRALAQAQPDRPRGRHLGRLLGANDTLRLLDLHNTGLFDEGVEALVEGFVEESGALHLRHLYLSAGSASAHAVRASRACSATRRRAPSCRSTSRRTGWAPTASRASSSSRGPVRSRASSASTSAPWVSCAPTSIRS
ncbi:MAG: aldo/keto reductase [Sandaracinaceae bacterium]